MLRWMMPQISLDVIELTLVPSASKTVILNDFTAPFACVVDWGDNTFSAISANVPVSHSYADASPRTVTLRGSLGGFWHNTGASGKELVTAVTKIKSRSLVSLNNSFRGCTRLNSVNSFDAPNLNNLSYSFYQCASISAPLPPLWQLFPTAAHTGCFSQSCKSCWAQYSSGCGNRQYVSAVPGQTYYQRFGTGCSKRQLVAAVPSKSWYQQYGTGCSKRKLVAAVPGKTYYQQFGTGCSKLTISGGSSGISYYSQYGEKCPKLKYVAAVPNTSWYQQYGTKCQYRKYWLIVDTGRKYYRCERLSGFADDCQESNCSFVYKYGNDSYYKCSILDALCAKAYCKTLYSQPTPTRYWCSAGYDCKSSGCIVTYSTTQPAYYTCSSGGNCKETACTVIYNSGQAAYYTCSSGGNCKDSGCTITYSSGQSAWYRCTRSGASCATSGCAYPYANEDSYNAARNAGWA